ncbi:uncharacterized protein LOC122429036 [Cervus canadensis]|uniref:uncharacterized protein LOC122429036 n=1 Tax=Cervus canadensis TaxID=1574408 RepID=UPI001C9E256F|nr:uncharacterized protein LOC122429036 [Cervus canadensis]
MVRGGVSLKKHLQGYEFHKAELLLYVVAKLTPPSPSPHRHPSNRYIRKLHPLGRESTSSGVDQQVEAARMDQADSFAERWLRVWDRNPRPPRLEGVDLDQLVAEGSLAGRTKERGGVQDPPGGAGGCGGGVPGAGAAGRAPSRAPAGDVRPSGAQCAECLRPCARPCGAVERWPGHPWPGLVAPEPARGHGKPGGEESGSGEARRDARTLTRTRRRGARPARLPRGGRARRRRRLGLRARRCPAPALQPPRGTARSSPPRATRRPAATFLEKDHTCANSSLWRRDVGIEALSGGLCRREECACVSAPAQGSRNGEGDLSVLQSLGSRLRESAGKDAGGAVTDRLPWLSYHSADAVRSKGTVL